MKFLQNKMIQSLGIYTLSNVLNSAIPFLLLPILTNYLAPSDYGVLTNFTYAIGILIPFIGLNMMASLQVIFVKKHDEFASYISSGLVLVTILTVAFSLLLIAFGSSLEQYLGVPKRFLYLLAVYATYQNLVEVLLSIWRMEDKAIQYGVFRIVRTILELVIAIILIVGFGWSFEGSIYALIYSYGSASLVTLIILFKKGLLVKHLEKKHMIHLVQYGLPLVPHVLGGIIIGFSDKLVLTHYHGLSSNGIYSVAFMVGQVISLLQNSFNQAWVPWVFQKLKEGKHEDKERIVYWTYVYLVAILAITVLFYFCTPLIFFFLGKSYESGITIVLWIALGFAFNGMYKMVSVYFFYEEKTGQLAVLSMITAVLNLVLIFLTVPKYKFEGAAISMMISFSIQFLLTWWWSTRITPMPWSILWKKNER